MLPLLLSEQLSTQRNDKSNSSSRQADTRLLPDLQNAGFHLPQCVNKWDRNVALWQLQPGVSRQIVSPAISGWSEQCRRSQPSTQLISGTSHLRGSCVDRQRGKDDGRTVTRLMPHWPSSDRTWVGVLSHQLPALRCQKGPAMSTSSVFGSVWQPAS